MPGTEPGCPLPLAGILCFPVSLARTWVLRHRSPSSDEKEVPSAGLLNGLCRDAPSGWALGVPGKSELGEQDGREAAAGAVPQWDGAGWAEGSELGRR